VAIASTLRTDVLRAAAAGVAQSAQGGLIGPRLLRGGGLERVEQLLVEPWRGGGKLVEAPLAAALVVKI
jgi:hypothetical protein